MEEKKRQAYSTLVFTLFALSFFGLFAINPTISTIVNLQKQVSDSQLVDTQLSEKITSLGVLKTKYDQLSENLPLVFSAIPQKPQVGDLAGKFQAIAQSSGVSLTRLQISSVSLEKTPIASSSSVLTPTVASSFTFSLSATGSHDAILNFLSLLPSFDRLITIDAISLSSVTTETKTLQLLLDINGNAYFQP